MDALEREVLAAKENEDRLNEFIADSKPWILRCAGEAAHHYVTDSDDEYSVAMLAFAEAVKSYESGKGSFKSFSAVVMKRRVVDYLRGEGRYTQNLVFVTPESFGGELEEETAAGINLQVQKKVAEESAAVGDDPGARAREEIAEAQSILAAYGFSFFDLTDCSPKAEKTKKSCALAVRVLLGSAALMERMRKSRTLPMKELSAESGVPRKILDRHRKYLIAAAEILSGDFPIISEYMSFIRKD